MQLAPQRNPFLLREVVKLTGGNIVGDDSIVISHVAPIQDAGEGAITLVANKEAQEIAKKNKASAYIIEEKYAKDLQVNGIIVPDGREAFGIILGLFKREVIHDVTISSKATIEEDVKLGKNVSVYDYSYIASGAEIGDNTVIYPGVFIGPESKIGKDCTIYPQVVIKENVVIGDRVIIHPGALIGVEGFGFVYTDSSWQKVPQIGGVVIGDDVEIFSNTSIATGAAGPTIISNGVKIGDMIHVGHNCQIGKDSILVGQTGLAGSTILGERVKVGGQVMFAGQQRIGDDCGIMSKSLVDGDLSANEIVSGIPARDHRTDYRIKAVMQDLPELRRQVKELAKKIERLAIEEERKEN
ncbi:MAG TPA: UDP-3-O-(3-hydroxymyristoyl)glucosamine N-acyltransferase [Firmicutes bacterium]|nr:UDP-3-O-(3-hydroxymyristoyl)glucosamine N-acyltransferase [Bacillota bacterium]